MGFFKEFKDDLSQAVNELLPDDELNQEDKIAQEEIVNTLDSDDIGSDDEDNMKMKEWLDNFTQEDTNYETTTEETVNEHTEEMMEGGVSEINTFDSDESMEEDNSLERDGDEIMDEVESMSGEENMDDNIDIELLEALESEEEAEIEEKQDIKPEPKIKAASAVSEDEVTVIAKGTTITGNITSDGSLDVMGTIVGDIECLGKLTITGKVKGTSTAAEIFVNTERMEGSIASEGSVKVGLGTVIIGDITATSGVIAGAIKGEIDINGPIVIDSTAIIKGNIKAKSIQVNNGAVVEGFCSLSYSNIEVDNIFE